VAVIVVGERERGHGVDVLPDQLVNVFDRGGQARVPLLAGFNSGEIRSLTPLAPPVPASAAVYESTIRERYGDLADAFLKLYPSDNLKESIFATTRDALYGWTAERLVRKQAALGVPSGFAWPRRVTMMAPIRPDATSLDWFTRE